MAGPLVALLLTLCGAQICSLSVSAASEASALASEDSSAAADPQLLIVKLRPKPKRSRADVEKLGAEWSKSFVERGETHKVSTIDKDKLAIQILNGKDVPKVKEFVLQQYEAYEVEVNKEQHRRASDSEPFSELMRRLLGQAKHQRRRRIRSRTREQLRSKRGGGGGGGGKKRLPGRNAEL